jgi:hypothetical protein
LKRQEILTRDEPPASRVIVDESVLRRHVTWRKASYSVGNGGACVEVASTAKALVAVRDSKDPNGPKLVFAPSVWGSFIQRTRSATPDLG